MKAAESDPAILRAKLKEFTGETVICLHAIDQPLVTDMQNCIRFQAGQLDECALTIVHLLKRIANHKQVRYYCGAGTETYDRLTKALALILGVDQAEICARLLRLPWGQAYIRHPLREGGPMTALMSALLPTHAELGDQLEQVVSSWEPRPAAAPSKYIVIRDSSNEEHVILFPQAVRHLWAVNQHEVEVISAGLWYWNPKSGLSVDGVVVMEIGSVMMNLWPRPQDARIIARALAAFFPFMNRSQLP